MRRSMRSGSACGGPAGCRIDESTPVAWVSMPFRRRPMSSRASSARTPAAAKVTAARRAIRRMLLRLRRRLGALGDDVLLEVDRGAVLELRRDPALLETLDVDLRLLPLRRGERVARPHGKLVALQVREDPVAVPVVLDEHADRVVPRRDRPREDLDRLEVVQLRRVLVDA